MRRDIFKNRFNSDIQLSDEERKSIIEKSIKNAPWKLRCTIAMEELAELGQQISKQIRGIGDRLGLIEEMADVYICLTQLESIFNISHDDLQRAIDIKMIALKHKNK